jgi:aspartate carbamoyltransferase catalytic subunit
MTTATALRTRHLLGIADLDASEIDLILQTAFAMKEVGTRPIKKVPTLRGRTIINLFFEPSTRTRMSFELAEKRLSADTLGMTVAGSSVTKGETLMDTARNLEAMSPDMIVMRHASSGAPHQLARICRASIINAGDGMHEHPTQALLDGFTMLESKGRLAGLRVAIIGDIAHSRVARSNLHLLTKFGASVVLCGPPPLLPREFELFSPHVIRTFRMEEAITDADVIMMLRVQFERQSPHRVPSASEYFRFYGLRVEHLRAARPDAIVMHPGPINRGREIASEVADFPRSVILNQVENGIAVRMAVLDLLLADELTPHPAKVSAS